MWIFAKKQGIVVLEPEVFEAELRFDDLLAAHPGADEETGIASFSLELTPSNP